MHGEGNGVPGPRIEGTGTYQVNPRQDGVQGAVGRHIAQQDQGQKPQGHRQPETMILLYALWLLTTNLLSIPGNVILGIPILSQNIVEPRKKKGKFTKAHGLYTVQTCKVPWAYIRALKGQNRPILVVSIT